MRRLPLFLLLGILCSLPTFADEGHHHELTAQELGSVHFPVSCAQGVQKDFDRAVALLHSFQYEQARAAFEGVAQKDPLCAMAQWGVAMSYYHGLWENSDYDAGRKAMVQADSLAAKSRDIFSAGFIQTPVIEMTTGYLGTFCQSSRNFLMPASVRGCLESWIMTE